MIPTNFANGLSDENPDLAVPWEYEQLLRVLRGAPIIWADRHIRREKGLLKFICHECGSGNHEGCAGEPNNDQSWCDCQHKGSEVER